MSAIKNGIGWKPSHNNNGFNAMLETDRAAIREDLITRIVAASGKPCPTIVPALRAKHKETGKTCSLYGMPLGYRNEDYVTVTVGHVYRSNDGTTYGTVYESPALAEAAHDARAEAAAADFRNRLESMPASELNDQAAYWLKG